MRDKPQHGTVVLMVNGWLAVEQDEAPGEGSGQEEAAPAPKRQACKACTAGQRRAAFGADTASASEASSASASAHDC